MVRWRLSDLAQWAWEEFGVSVSRQTISRELHGLGYVKLSAPPRHHAQEPEAIPEFKKNFPAQVAEIRAVLPLDTNIEIDPGGRKRNLEGKIHNLKLT
jgi:hypothetical protein